MICRILNTFIACIQPSSVYKPDMFEQEAHMNRKIQSSVLLLVNDERVSWCLGLACK